MNSGRGLTGVLDPGNGANTGQSDWAVFLGRGVTRGEEGGQLGCSPQLGHVQKRLAG
jgi:hypothetical protein